MQEHAISAIRCCKKIPVSRRSRGDCLLPPGTFRRQQVIRGDLKGEEIPLGARIFSVADTLDAITSDRVYRPAQTLEAAREEIKKWSGRQFDPEVVKVFLDMPDKIWEDLRHQIDTKGHPPLSPPPSGPNSTGAGA